MHDHPFSSSDIFKNAVPLMLSLLLEQLIGMMDIAFLGRYGQAELAAAGPANILFLTVMMQGFGYAVGAQALMARANGAGEFARVGALFRQGALFLTLFALMVALSAHWWVAPLLASFMTHGDVVEAASAYTFWRFVGLPLTFGCVILRSLFISTLRPSVLTVNALIMVSANALFNYALVFGAGPIPELGITGSAVASSLAEAVSLAHLVYAARKSGLTQRYALSAPICWDGATQAELFRTGRWLMVQEGLAFAVWLNFFIMVEHLGEVALAVSNVVKQLGSLLFLFIHAFGTTCGALAANLYGARRFEAIDDLARRGLFLTGACMLVPAALYALFPDALVSLFTSIEAVRENADATFYVMLAGYLFAIPADFYFFMIAGLGFARVSSIMTIVASLLYVCYTALLAWFKVDVAVMWTADWLYYGVVGVGAAVFLRRAPWRDAEPVQPH